VGTVKLSRWSVPSIPQVKALQRIVEHGPMTRAEARDLINPITRKALDAHRMIDLYEHPELGPVWEITRRGLRALELAEGGG
jgi:hypothetical protein